MLFYFGGWQLCGGGVKVHKCNRLWVKNSKRNMFGLKAKSTQTDRNITEMLFSHGFSREEYHLQVGLKAKTKKTCVDRVKTERQVYQSVCKSVEISMEMFWWQWESKETRETDGKPRRKMEYF